MLKQLSQSIEAKEKESWLRPEVTREWQDRAGIKESTDFRLKEQSVIKIFEDIKKIISQTKMPSAVALYPGFNPVHWEKTEPILNETELDKETIALENRMVSVQGWSLLKFSQQFPMIYQANIIFHSKQIYLKWNQVNEDPEENPTATYNRYVISTGSPLDSPIQVVFNDENKRHEGHEDRKYYRIEKQRKGNLC